jgi:alkylhydroperoxidase family enzyme
MLAHGAVLLRRKMLSAPQLIAAVEDYRSAGLAPAEVAVMAFAEKVAGDAATVTPEDVGALRGHGLSDLEILDVALAAAARCFFSKTLDALGAEPDAALTRLEEPLRTALSVGRPLPA